MFITRVKLQNWKNFREVDVPLFPQTYLIGPNASGKSNFLDVFRFLRDVSKPSGGGLQKAVEDRGGISKLRCLHARSKPEIHIEVHLREGWDSGVEWIYRLSFDAVEIRQEKRPLIMEESVHKNGELIFSRPDQEDRKDRLRRTQTALEQINANKKFRKLAGFFSDVAYSHLVPQLLRYANKLASNFLEDDPLGQRFLEHIARMPEKQRNQRLQDIEVAMRIAVPRFDGLRFRTDETGRPHLEARYAHHRPRAGWQREDQFSDGTLRLLGLLWTLFENNSLFLLEEPELSLNQAIVEHIPALIHRIQYKMEHEAQVIISTHSEALLKNPGIDSQAILILEPIAEGTAIRSPNVTELATINAGFSAAEVLLPKIKPAYIEQLGLL